MAFASILRQADIFQNLTPDQVGQIASICGEKWFKLGEIIFEEKSTGNELYVIARGEVEILYDPSLVSDQQEIQGRPTTIVTLRRGQSFGEIALVDQGLRSASARSASSETHLIVIPRTELMRLCESDPRLGYQLMNNLAADLALKIRNSGMMIRGKLLYSRYNPSEDAQG